MQFLESGNVAVVLLLIFLVLTLANMASYFTVAGCSHLLLFVWFKDRFFPGRILSHGQNAKAIHLSMIAVIGSSALTAPIDLLMIRGWSRLYLSVDDYGWGYLLFSVVALLVFTETTSYWIHRALHHRWLYRSLHRFHHEFRDPTAWVTLAFHPLELFLFTFPYLLFVFLLPLQIVVYVVSLMVVTLWSYQIHSQQSFFPWSFMNYTAFHTLHHKANKYNYGQIFLIWDRLCGTYGSPDEGTSDSTTKRRPAVAASAPPSSQGSA